METPYNPIFPGMDPFIEGSWQNFHNLFIGRIFEELSQLLVPRYDVNSESYLSLYSRPNVSVLRGKPNTEPFEYSTQPIGEATRVITPTIYDLVEPLHIEIHDDEGRLVTVLEVLSPSNKKQHRDRYISGRDRLLYPNKIHLVEIDLLRDGDPIEPNIQTQTCSVLVVRAQEPMRGELYEIGLRDSLPVIPVPLLPGDADVPLDLGFLFRETYIRGRYRYQLDYHRKSAVPFSIEDAAWVNQLLKEANVL